MKIHQTLNINITNNPKVIISTVSTTSVYTHVVVNNSHMYGHALACHVFSSPDIYMYAYINGTKILRFNFL